MFPMRSLSRISPSVQGTRQSTLQALSSKPSDGLEPSTPSLPSWNQAGKRGHERVTATTKAPQARRIGRAVLTRAYPRVVGVMFAPRSHDLFATLTTLGADNGRLRQAARATLVAV